MKDINKTKEQLINELVEKRREIAKLEKKEQALNKTSFYLDRINDSVILINTKEEIIKVNREFSNLWGYSYKEVKGKSVFKLFPKKEIPKQEDSKTNDIKNKSPKISVRGKSKEKELAKTKEELAEVKDKYLRLYSEFDSLDHSEIRTGSNEHHNMFERWPIL